MKGSDLCKRCSHPRDWHRLDDTKNIPPTSPDAQFRCIGYDCERPGSPPHVNRCKCPDFVSERRKLRFSAVKTPEPAAATTPGQPAASAGEPPYKTINSHWEKLFDIRKHNMNCYKIYFCGAFLCSRQSQSAAEQFMRQITSAIKKHQKGQWQQGYEAGKYEVAQPIQAAAPETQRPLEPTCKHCQQIYQRHGYGLEPYPHVWVNVVDGLPAVGGTYIVGGYKNGMFYQALHPFFILESGPTWGCENVKVEFPIEFWSPLPKRPAVLTPQKEHK